MAIVKWEPLREIEQMFDRYTRAMGLPSGQGLELMGRGDWAPKVDVSESDTEFVIKAEIPEVKKEDVKVSVDKGVLTLRGERKQEKEEKGKRFHRIERSYGSFARSFTLPDNVDDSKIRATFKDGMLVLQLPKNGKAKPKAVEVKIQ